MTPALEPLEGRRACSTVAVVVYGDNPEIQYDLDRFSAARGIPAAVVYRCCPEGRPYPSANVFGWDTEAALDVEAVHLADPAARLLLVEAYFLDAQDLLWCATWASLHADVVSMSWGTPGLPSDLSGFPALFLAAAGDAPGPLDYPAKSRGVVSVGAEGTDWTRGLLSGPGALADALTISLHGQWVKAAGSSEAAPLWAGRVARLEDLYSQHWTAATLVAWLDRHHVSRHWKVKHG